MAKVVLNLEVYFDGNEEELTPQEVDEFVRTAIETAEECCGSCTLKIERLEVLSV